MKDSIDLKELREILYRSEMLEMSLNDASLKLEKNIDLAKSIQKNGLIIDKVQTQKIVTELKKQENKFKWVWIYLSGFLSGLMAIYIFYLFKV